jgi:L-2-hydroxycarboxylate dehydrogenase (NAD+)
MNQLLIQYDLLSQLCQKVFSAYSISADRAGTISNVLLQADLINYSLFGHKQEIREHFSNYLMELRASGKAIWQERIYTHGEKELERYQLIKQQGIPIDEKTGRELEQITWNWGLEPAWINLLNLIVQAPRESLFDNNPSGSG